MTQGPPLARRLTGYWRFDEGRGSTTSRDHSPAQRDCRLRDIDPQRAWVDSPLAGGNGFLFSLPTPRENQRKQPETIGNKGKPMETKVNQWKTI